MGCEGLEDERAAEETLKVLSIKLVMSLMKLIAFLPSGPQRRTQHIESVSAPSRMWPKFSTLCHYLPKKDPVTNTLICLKGAAAIVSDRLKKTGSER